MVYTKDVTEVIMCGCNGKKLCPVSFGLALGLVCALGYFAWVLWVIYYGPSAMMLASHMPVPTLGSGAVHALWALLKGFIFGFFVALFYDCISGCCKNKMCCKKSNCECGCCAQGSKPGLRS